MDKKSMGTFLTDLRKEKGLTQQEVADNLNVSNKTISKWERDEGYPEITMLPEIAKFYEITTDELLNGSKVIEKTENESSEKIRCKINDKISAVIYSLRSLCLISPVLLATFGLSISFSDGGFLRIIAHYGIYFAAVLAVVWFLLSLYVALKEVPKNSLTETKALKTVGITFFFMLISVFFVILLTVDENAELYLNSYFHFIPSLFFSIITTFCFALIFKKRLKLDASLKKNKRIIKKIVVIAVIFTIVGAIIATSFSLFELKNLEPIEYTVDFINDEMFSTEEEAISEYNKIKKAVTENFTVFQIYSEKGDELILNEIHITSEKRGESYFISELYGSEEEKGFFTKEEKDEFIKETVVSEVHSDYLYSMDENIVFDDENYCISFNDVDESESFADGAVTFYVITATGILSALYIILFIYYNKKKVRV